MVILAACAGQFLVVLDVSVVTVALPSMRADLGLSWLGLQWVLNAYSIAFAGFMLLGGRAGRVRIRAEGDVPRGARAVHGGFRDRRLQAGDHV